MTSWRDGQNHLQRAWTESPLLVGAASVVLGAMVGLALPETDHENQLMGEARDIMMETVEDTVREKVDRVQQVATNAANAAKSAVGLSSTEDSATNTGAADGL